MIGYKQEEFLPVNEIKISANSLAVNRGYGAFDYFIVHNGVPFQLNQHLERFSKTIELLRLQNKLVKKLPEIVAGVLAKNNQQNYGIKLFVLPITEVFTELVVLPVESEVFSSSLINTGAKLITKEYKRFLPLAKTTNYLASQYFKSEVDDAGAADVLYYDNGIIRETSRGSFFLVKNSTVYTAKNEVLHSITRSVLFNIMDSIGISYELCDLKKDELYNADEAFVASTNKLVLPITHIDGKSLGDGNPGNMALKLYQLFNEYKEQYCNNN